MWLFIYVVCRSFDAENLMWIWLYQFLSSPIYFDADRKNCISSWELFTLYLKKINVEISRKVNYCEYNADKERGKFLMAIIDTTKQNFNENRATKEGALQEKYLTGSDNNKVCGGQKVSSYFTLQIIILFLWESWVILATLKIAKWIPLKPVLRVALQSKELYKRDLVKATLQCLFNFYMQQFRF